MAKNINICLFIFILLLPFKVLGQKENVLDGKSIFCKHHEGKNFHNEFHIGFRFLDGDVIPDTFKIKNDKAKWFTGLITPYKTSIDTVKWRDNYFILNRKTLYLTDIHKTFLYKCDVFINSDLYHSKISSHLHEIQMRFIERSKENKL